MAVAASLHAEVGRRGVRQVLGHHRRGAAIEREGGLQHAAVADRHQRRYALPIGFAQNRDRILSMRIVFPPSEFFAGDRRSKRFSFAHTNVRRNKRRSFRRDRRLWHGRTQDLSSHTSPDGERRVDCVAALLEQLFEPPFTQSMYRGSRHTLDA
jgi:hypothetical protein